MRPPEHSDDQIIQAGRHIQELGKPVTGFALRQRLGGGNPARLLSVWQASTDSQAAPPPSSSHLPPEMLARVDACIQSTADHMRNVFADVYQVAHQAADARVTDALAKADAARRQAQLEIDEASSLVDRHNEQISALKIERDNLARELDSVRLALASMTARYEAHIESASLETSKRDQDLREARDAARQAQEEAAHLRGMLQALSPAPSSHAPLEPKQNTTNKRRNKQTQ